MTLKKAICILFALVMAFQLAACSETGAPSKDTSSDENVSVGTGNGKKSYDKPTSSDTVLIYSGKEIKFIPDGFDGDAMSISGNTAVDEGEYAAIVSLNDKDGTCWADGSTDDLQLKWSISKEETSCTVTDLGGKLQITSSYGEASYSAEIAYPEGATYQVSKSGRITLLFGDRSDEEITFEISGKLCGSLSFDINRDTDAVIELGGIEILSYGDCPIYISSAKNADISAKKDTENSINDLRSEAAELKSAIYSVCDLKLKGTGKLTVVSENNNGIHSKDDLTVQKLTLSVSCIDNALKGNDGVTVKSGEITLISRKGDGIKTSDSSVSSKGNQKGDAVIEGGKISIFAACDGIDAAHDAVIEGGEISIMTDRYSEYSEEVAAAKNGADTLKAMSTEKENRGMGGPGGGGPGGGPGGGFGGGFGGDPGGGFGGGHGGGMGGFGGGGNTDKGDYSTKGIKAANDITVSGGEITVRSYDDALHANSGNSLENGLSSTGNVTVKGGTLTLSSNDDAIHADGAAVIEGGVIDIKTSYEGIEGDRVEIKGGEISVVSSDDGINGTATDGESIVISGGTLYVYAGGDGVDSNSHTGYGGIVFSGGKCVIISTGRDDSAIDTENGYSYTSGTVVAVGISGMMQNETVNCRNFGSVGSKATVNIAQDAYLTVDGVLTLKMPCAMNSYVVVLGKTGAAVSSSQTSQAEFDANGVCWLK